MSLTYSHERLDVSPNKNKIKQTNPSQIHSLFPFPFMHPPNTPHTSALEESRTNSNKGNLSCNFWRQVLFNYQFSTLCTRDLNAVSI